MVSNNTVNIQDIFAFRSDSPDLHLHESSIVDWGRAGGGGAGGNHYTWEHWCRIMQPCYDHSNTSESLESIHNDEKQLHHNWAGAIYPCILVHFQGQTVSRLWVDEEWREKTTEGTKPQRQTCILHLTRSRGTTAVCVVPQLRIPPKPHRMKYFWEPNSQLSPSEETQGRLSEQDI